MLPVVPEEWNAIFVEWKESGLYQREFCIMKNISYDKFHYWLRKYRGIPTRQRFRKGSIPIIQPPFKYSDESPPLSSNENSFIQLEINDTFPQTTSDYNTSFAEIILSNGTRIVLNTRVDSSFIKSLL
jgi:hypothetical protein